MEQQKIKRFNAIAESLKELRRPHDGHFKRLAENFLPQRARFLKSKNDKSRESENDKIINPRPSFALETMQNGMHTGITSPARPWFKLAPYDPDLEDNVLVKEHFESAEREMKKLLSRSGLYSVLHTLWGDLGLYGHDCAIIEDDFKTGLYGQALVPGEYWIAANSRGMIDTLYREIRMTIKQIVDKFVYKNDSTSKPDWSVVSGGVKNLWDQDKISEKIFVRHLIMPRVDRDTRRLDAKNKPIMSVYWEEEKSDKLLGDFGYDINPILASRWDVRGTDTYGTSPAMKTLPAARSLQLKAQDLAEAMKRFNRPPVNVPIELRNSGFSIMPEAVNFMADPTRGAVPAFQVNVPVEQLANDIMQTEQKINEGMYANLFMMIANLDRRQITAREIDERSDEKLLGLGPVLERQQREKLRPLLNRAYQRVIDLGYVKPLPEEFDNLPTDIDYISTLAQAMKAVATGSIERLFGFAGNLAAVDPNVMDNIDTDIAVKKYADMIGVPDSILRPTDEIGELRQQRAQQAQQAEALEQAKQVTDTVGVGAQAAKVLSEANNPRSGGGNRDILADIGLG